MSFNLMILYPCHNDAKFDMQYYLHVHMPLVEKYWRPAGLLGWKVIEFGAPQSDDYAGVPPPRIANLMTWEDEESYCAASKGPGASEICADAMTFSNRKPIFITGRTVDMG